MLIRTVCDEIDDCDDGSIAADDDVLDHYGNGVSETCAWMPTMQMTMRTTMANMHRGAVSRDQHAPG